MVGFNRFLVAVSLCLACTGLKAQDASFMQFETKRIVAGKIKETDRPVYVYSFVNTGSEPIEITGLTANCSCVRPSFDRKVTAPGERGSIKVEYNPEGHPGHFERRIFVYTDLLEGKPTVVLELRVEVEDNGDRMRWFPVAMGNIRLKAAEHCFRSDLKDVMELNFINVGEAPVNLSFRNDLLPAYLEAWCETPDVKPGEEGTICIAFDPEKYGQSASGELGVPVILKGTGASPKASTIMIMIK